MRFSRIICNQWEFFRLLFGFTAHAVPAVAMSAAAMSALKNSYQIWLV